MVQGTCFFCLLGGSNWKGVRSALGSGSWGGGEGAGGGSRQEAGWEGEQSHQFLPKPESWSTALQRLPWERVSKRILSLGRARGRVLHAHDLLGGAAAPGLGTSLGSRKPAGLALRLPGTALAGTRPALGQDGHGGGRRLRREGPSRPPGLCVRIKSRLLPKTQGALSTQP